MSTIDNLMALAQAWVVVELKEPGGNAAFIACADLCQALTEAFEFERDVSKGHAEEKVEMGRRIAELTLGFDRYEKARKLNPTQWAELHRRNLAGEFFDDMIDALP